MKLNPGEHHHYISSLPPGVRPEDVKPMIRARCGCGAMMVQKGNRCICPKDRWWKFWEHHARLQISVGFGRRGQG